jgi:hypothetical protein
MVIIRTEEPFVIEARSVEEANRIDTDKYRFERYSETKSVYIFVRRKDR